MVDYFSFLDLLDDNFLEDRHRLRMDHCPKVHHMGHH